MGEFKKRIKQKQIDYADFDHMNYDDIIDEAKKEFEFSMRGLEQWFKSLPEHRIAPDVSRTLQKEIKRVVETRKKWFSEDD